ncbi:sensor histidine kinase [Aquimonas sp.]|jgi:two-component system sensor histidine kinase BaeS|uniref:sensor histidine kinase n=1 Tax=Aquimonas sp. TaxID=1872588 RepID=UPI0037BF4E1F
MNISLRLQIASVAIAISVGAALIAAFVPGLLFELRDYLFMASLPAEDQETLRRLIEVHGSCSGIVHEFQGQHGITRWDFNYHVALTVAIIATAVIGGTLAFKLAGGIAAPIVSLSMAAKAVANGARDNERLPPRSGPREVGELIGDFALMTESLAAADRDLRLRSNGIAHELRTPLAVIRARLSGAKDGVFVADPAFFDSLLGQVSQIERLTSDLSMLCDSQGLGFSLERAPTSVNDVVEAVIHCLGPMAADHGVTLTHHGDGPVMADADAARLERAIANLVENAIRHAAATRVTVTVDDAGDRCRIVVVDDGRGWPVRDPDTLKEPFVTGDSAARERSKRTGLGLAIVQAIARAHHGSLALESSPGGGARAVLTIPKTIN